MGFLGAAHGEGGSCRMTTNHNEWYNEWQQVTTSGTTNENGTIHFKEWMIAILIMTNTDTLLQGMDGFKQSG